MCGSERLRHFAINISVLRSLPSTTSSPTARSISLYSCIHIASYALQSVVLGPQLGIKIW